MKVRIEVEVDITSAYSYLEISEPIIAKELELAIRNFLLNKSPINAVHIDEVTITYKPNAKNPSSQDFSTTPSEGPFF